MHCGAASPSAAWRTSSTSTDSETLGLRLRGLEISNHVCGMAADVGDLVAAMDATVGIDEVAVSHRVFGILLARSTGNFVFRPDRAINIAQQMEREVLRF